MLLAQTAAEKPRLPIVELTVSGGADPSAASVLTESIATEVNNRGFFSPITPKDIQTLIGLERQKSLVGCSESSGSCLAELAGAMGARYVLSGSLGKLGEAYQLNLQMLDSEKAQTVGRSTRIAKDLEALRAQIPYAVAEATGTPLPPPPSRVLPYSLIGVGALGVVVGAVLEVNALTDEGAINSELNPKGCTTACVYTRPLDTKEAYQTRLDSARNRELLGGIALGVGAALITTGILLNPAEVVSSGGGAKVSLLIGPSGAAVVGVFP
ncbi:MAG: hypothetical protein ACJ790_16695 [Myxococcaceae bacterium]